MTYRQKYFELQKLNNEYLNNTVIKTLLIDCGGFNDFFDLIKHFDEQLINEERLNDCLEKLTHGVPLQYVLGYTYFVNSNYYVNEDVLIPRQETEQLAVSTLTLVVKMFGKDPNITIVDIGTGSGILGIYLKEYFQKSRVICTDISEKALQIADKNSKKHDVDIELRQGDMLEPISDLDSIDVVISNPPYIGDSSTVDPQTLKYEPHLALFATPKTKYYEEILTLIDKGVMNKKQFLFAFEIGEDMEEELTNLLESKYLGVMYKFEKDMYGKVRFLYVMNQEGVNDVLC